MGDYYYGYAEKTEITILDLPDIFMISVFKFFDIKERLKLSNICKKWNSLLKDGSLWSTIDLRKYKNELNLQDLKKLVLFYGCESTKDLILCGNYSYHYTSKLTDSNVNLLNVKLIELDSTFISKILSTKSPQIQSIYLEFLDLRNISLKDFEALNTLKSLTLKWCNLSQNFFENETEFITNIEHFNLFKSGRIMLEDVKRICLKMPYLITLSINQAQSSIKDDSVELIVKHLKYLEHLELTNTLISDGGIQTICESPYLARNLKFLNISMSSCLTNNCLLLLSENLQCLKSLYLTSCFGISNVKLLQNFVNLNYLNLNNTSIEREKIRELLLPVLSKCEIEFGHEKMLNRKLMWTINGSRNCVCSF